MSHSHNLDTSVEFSMSQLSLHSNGSQSEDWDRSLIENDLETHATHTPRNSVAFPANGDAEVEATPRSGSKGNRSLSELLRLHAEKGTECSLSPDEASRLGEVLGQWINASSSPYEDEDDFFTKGTQDDMSIPTRSPSSLDARPRGQSESASSRPPSSTGKRS